MGSIVDSSGTPLSSQQARPVTSAGFEVSHDFDLRSGHGSVKVEIVRLVEAIKALPRFAPDTDIMAEAENGTWLKLEDVVQLLSKPLRLMPAEAKMLGYQLICYGEESIGNAITMRILIEAGMAPGDALQNLVTFSQGTRQDHAVAHARAIQEGRVEEKMDEPAKGGVQ